MSTGSEMSPTEQHGNTDRDARKVVVQSERSELLAHLQAMLESLMVGLGLVFLVLLLVDFAGPDLSERGQRWLGDAMTAIWVVFLADFAVRFVVAPSKLGILRANWLGALSLALTCFVVLAGAAGALLSGRVARRLGVGRAMVWCAVVSNVGVLLIPLAAVAPALAAVVLAIGVFVQGLGGTGTNVQTYAIRQAVVPNAVMGRANAVYRLLTYGFMPAGALIGGFLGEVLGLQAARLSAYSSSTTFRAAASSATKAGGSSQ